MFFDVEQQRVAVSGASAGTSPKKFGHFAFGEIEDTRPTTVERRDAQPKLHQDLGVAMSQMGQSQDLTGGGWEAENRLMIGEEPDDRKIMVMERGHEFSPDKYRTTDLLTALRDVPLPENVGHAVAAGFRSLRVFQAFDLVEDGSHPISREAIDESQSESGQDVPVVLGA